MSSDSTAYLASDTEAHYYTSQQAPSVNDSTSAKIKQKNCQFAANTAKWIYSQNRLRDKMHTSTV